jgi:hypothetical protein
MATDFANLRQFWKHHSPNDASKCPYLGWFSPKAHSMSAASAKVIDFQAYRNARLAQQPAPSSSMAMPMMPALPAVTWLPVWFMPVYFIGSGQTAE